MWVEPTADNAVRVHAALADFGAPLTELRLSDLSTDGLIFQMGIPPNRIDVITAIDGVAFDEAWPGRLVAAYGDQSITVIGKAELICNKRATGRAQDALDADVLERS